MISKDLRKRLKRVVKQSLMFRIDELRYRTQVAELLRTRVSSDGYVYIDVWSRDCDLAEGNKLRKILPLVPAFVRLQNEEFESAEGPTRITILHPAEIDDWEPTFRDRAAEAAGY